MSNDQTDIAIVGTGPQGLITALALSEFHSYQIVLLGHRPTKEQLGQDTRSTAFMPPSINLLEKIGIWQDCHQTAAPLKALQLIDETSKLVRAPDCYFTSDELSLDAFAQNIPNTDLMMSLLKHIELKSNIKWIQTPKVNKVSPGDETVILEYDEGCELHGRLCIGADGRNSICRQASGIGFKKWDYHQTAIACTFSHSRPHKGVSTEFHLESGPLTLIPLEEYRSSLVWSLTPHEADRCAQLSTSEFCKQLAKVTHNIRGSIKEAGPRAKFPISCLRVNEFAANRIALVGEAAHTVPPIGAQGLNLGIRDCAYLVESLDNNVSETKDPGSESVLKDYNESRKFDVWSKTYAIDLLNKSLLMSFFPLKALRYTGLHALNLIPALRKAIMQQGLGSNHNPKSMILDQ